MSHLDFLTIYDSLSFLTESVRLQYTNFIFRHQDKFNESLSFDDAIRRLKLEEPVEYVFNIAEFCRYEFYVDKRCLIPRPETEEIVQLALQILKNKDQRTKNEELHYTFIDVGTGSGCIILSIANTLTREHVNPLTNSLLHPPCPSEKGNHLEDSGATRNTSPLTRNFQFKFIGLDISSSALEIAKINREKFGLAKDVELIHADFHDFDFSQFENLIVCSNLPYIPYDETLQKSVIDFEPHEALFGGKDGDELNNDLKKILKSLGNIKMLVMEGKDGKIESVIYD